MKYKCSTDNLKEWEIDSIIQSSGMNREETLRRVWDYMMDTKDDLDERVKRRREADLLLITQEEKRSGIYREIQLDVIRSVPIHSRQNREGQGRQDTES